VDLAISPPHPIPLPLGRGERGIILPLVLIFALLLIISGLAFMSLGIQENSLVQREISKRQAFYLAEAGLERALYDLRQDF